MEYRQLSRSGFSVPNLDATGWSLTPEQVNALDKASARMLAYPYRHWKQFKERNLLPAQV